MVPSFTDEGLQKAIELNRIIGSKYIIMASAGRVTGLDGWKTVADRLTAVADKLRPLGMATGYHNHQPEWQAIDGKRPMEVLAANTPKDVVLQLDVGTCVESGADPVAWINANPGRIRSVHCKDWGCGRESRIRCRVRRRRRTLEKNLRGRGSHRWGRVPT